MFRRAPAAELVIPDDLQALDLQTRFVEGKDELDYLAYHVLENENEQVYDRWRVVRLVRLHSLPVETRTDTRLLQKMEEVMWGLYKVSVPLDFIHLAAGIFRPHDVGVVQMYGISCLDATLEGAVRNSAIGMTPLVDNLRGVFRQMRLRPLDTDMTRFLARAMRFKYAVSTIGHPDPRDDNQAHTQRNQRTAGKAESSRAGYSEQQNEKFFRALAAGKHEFVWLVMASPIQSSAISQMLVDVSRDVSAWKSRQEGSKAISVGLALPIGLASGVAHSAQSGYGQSFANNYSHGVGTSFSEGQAHAVGSSVGGSHTVSAGHNVGVSQSESWGEAHTVGHSVSDATGHSVSKGANQNWGVAHTDSHSHTDTTTTSDGSSSSSGGGTSGGQVLSGNANLGAMLGMGASSGQTAGSSSADGTSAAIIGIGGDHSDATNQSNTTGSSQNVGMNSGLGFGVSDMSGWSSFGSSGVSHGVSQSSSDTWGTADTTSHSWGESLAVGDSSNHAVGASVADTVSHGVSIGRSEGWSQGVADSSSWSKSVSDTTSTAKGSSQSSSEGGSAGLASSQGLGRVGTLGASLALVPSFGVSKSYRTYDETARLVADLLTTQALLLRRCSMAGGWLTDIYTLTDSPEAIATVEAAVRQAFGGTEDVVTSIQTRYLSAAEQSYLRLHAAVFTPSTMRERIPGVIEAQRHATLMDPLMLSTLASPASMEYGAAEVVQEKTPDFAFYPTMNKSTQGYPSGIVGHQINTETGDLTNAPVILSEKWHTNTVFQGDTRFGKSEAAYRVALTVHRWGHAVVVFDFGKGWNRFFNSALDRRYFRLWQLRPNSAHPLRWAVLAVPPYIDPSTYISLVCETIGNAGRLGQVQLGLLQTTLRQVYLQAGVLTSDEEVISAATWKAVNEEEAGRLPGALRVVAGQPITRLSPDARQALAVLRSRKVSLRDWVRLLESTRQQRETTERERQALAAVLFRLRDLTYEPYGSMFGALADDEDAIVIEDLVMPARPGEQPPFVVFEADGLPNQFARSFFLTLIGGILYESWKVRFDRNGSRAEFPVDLFWEEANKVLAPDSGESSSDSAGSGAQSAAEMIQAWWRDGEKYQYRNHVIVQTLSRLPPGIVPSCNIGYFFRSKNPDDKKLIMSYIARSETGFVDQDYQRFLSRLPPGQCIVKFGLMGEITEMEPLLMTPLMVPMPLPSDSELRAYYAASEALSRVKKGQS